MFSIRIFNIKPKTEIFGKELNYDYIEIRYISPITNEEEFSSAKWNGMDEIYAFNV